MAADPGATTALPDEVKKNLKSIVLELRHLFEGDLGLGLKRLGIDVETGKVTPADEPALSYLTAEERETRSSLDAVLAKEAAMTKDVPEAVRALLREAAYTHLNRLIGLKCLELRGHLAIGGERTEVVTQRSDYGDLSKYLWTIRSKDARLLGDPELLWREGLLRACTAASAELGVLFDPEDPYARVWPSHKALMQAVRTLAELPESAFRADELLGWVYQYFQTEEKDRVFAELKTTKNKKISWSDIVPATQLYTERYMVDFLLQNSVGARWMEMYPDSRAKEAWLYYVEPATPHAREPRAVKEWTLLDPCCGSGHFLVVAFDLLVQLYAEERSLAQQGLIPADWAVPEAEVARTILERNLHGIDIDPRAVQLSALALYLKAKDLGLEGTPYMHLAIADCVLQRGEHYAALLDAYEDDSAASEAIEAIWSALENVRDLGSLVRIEEEVEAAVSRTRKRAAGRFDELTDWHTYKRELATRLQATVAAEAANPDERQRVFGVEAQKGLALLDLLSARYDVVCTNPPYMGSGNMGLAEKRYVERHYYEGRRDAYAAFLIRCLELTRPSGLAAMVARKQWMFASSYRDLRSTLLAGTDFRIIADLGARAFDQDTKLHDGVSVALTVACSRPTNEEAGIMTAIRATSVSGPAEKAALLMRASSESAPGLLYRMPQQQLQLIDGSPMAYWLPRSLVQTAASHPAGQGADRLYQVRDGMNTGDNARFLRLFWEHPPMADWRPITKGGGYKKWSGNSQYSVNWARKGAVIREAGLAGTFFRNTTLFFRPMLCYTRMANGALGARLIDDSAFDGTGLPVVPSETVHREALAAFLNSRAATYFCRLLSQSLEFRGGYVERLPRPSGDLNRLSDLGTVAVLLKSRLVACDPTERIFRDVPAPFRQSEAGSRGSWATSSSLGLEAVLLAVEAAANELTNELYELDGAGRTAIRAETGTPAGSLPLLAGSDAAPALPEGTVPLPQEAVRHLASRERRELSPETFEDLKARLRLLYIAGPGSKVEDSEADGAGDDEELASATDKPLPAETFLEELSQILEIHPISVYWLLLGLIEMEGVVCPSETKRVVEDWLSVNVLRMLGHRWPMQDSYEGEDGRPFVAPSWVDSDGIIALTSGMGEETLVGRVRRFLDAEFGPDYGHQAEVDLAHALGWKSGVAWGAQKPLGLDRWFERDLFKRHVSRREFRY